VVEGHNIGSRLGLAGRPVRWRAASIARWRMASGLRAGMPRPWRVRALRSDGQVMPNSAAAALMLPSRSASAKACSGSPNSQVFTAPIGGPLRVPSFRARFWVPATKAAGLEGLRIHDLRHTAVALWIAAGANPKEVSARAGHSSVSFTLDRYGHLYPEADAALRDRLDALYGTTRPAPASSVVRLPRRPGRDPSVAPGDPGNDKSAADGTPRTL
jgi:integrase